MGTQDKPARRDRAREDLGASARYLRYYDPSFGADVIRNESLKRRVKIVLKAIRDD